MSDLVETIETSRVDVEGFRRRALIVGVAALVIGAAGALISSESREQFFRSYLLAYIFWIAIPLGCFAILMLQHMSGGVWGLVTRRVLESSTRTFPLLALLFLPLLLGLKSIFPWASPERLAASPALNHAVEQKHLYLNIGFFIARAIFYFLVWIIVTRTLNRWSAEQDKTGERRLTSKLQGLSGPGLVLYGLTVTFAAIDWAMSLDPEWFSTIYGLLFMGGQGLAGMAFVIAVMVLLSQRAPMNEVIKPSHLHDLGKLMLAFLMIWAYFAFSQFLIIWAGNLPEEIPFYVRRIQSSWKYVGLGLIVLHFALPFVLLLSRDLKRSGRKLSMVAIGVIVMRYVDLIWLTGPELHEGRFGLSWMDLMLLAGIGGVWLWFFATELNRRPLLPIRDPEIESVFASGHGH
ncbi:MAG TPA: hypothetical protein VKN18_09425 [Blastocatellia bacterium]|nr:hypothetical protein [Blastocatellia bacterium]